MEHPNRRRVWPVDQIRAWVESEGKTHRWVAEQIGTGDQQVSKLCRKHGIAVAPRGPRPGPGHPNWQGGRNIDKDGYVLVWVADHPHAKRRPGKRFPGGYVLEHRLVMEAALGRYLLSSEVVHHRNNVNNDNRIENLELFSSNADHLRHELMYRCPQWTPEGRAKIAAASARRWERDRKRAPNPAAATEPGPSAPGRPAPGGRESQ